MSEKIITLCGSTRFTNEMLIKQWELSKEGHVVLSWNALPPGYFNKIPKEDIAHVAELEGAQAILDQVHRDKIDLSDEILVINVNDYIGESTKSEILYALKKHRKVSYAFPHEKRYWELDWELECDQPKPHVKGQEVKCTLCHEIIPNPINEDNYSTHMTTGILHFTKKHPEELHSFLSRKRILDVISEAGDELYPITIDIYPDGDVLTATMEIHDLIREFVENNITGVEKVGSVASGGI